MVGGELLSLRCCQIANARMVLDLVIACMGEHANLPSPNNVRPIALVADCQLGVALALAKWRECILLVWLWFRF